MTEFRLLIDGKLVEGASTLEVINPATGRTLTAAPRADRAQLDQVWVNKHLDLGPDIPYAGAKQSGVGTELGQEGLEEFTQATIINVASEGGPRCSPGFTTTGSSAGGRRVAWPRAASWKAPTPPFSSSRRADRATASPASRTQCSGSRTSARLMTGPTATSRART